MFRLAHIQTHTHTAGYTPKGSHTHPIQALTRAYTRIYSFPSLRPIRLEYPENIFPLDDREKDEAKKERENIFCLHFFLSLFFLRETNFRVRQ